MTITSTLTIDAPITEAASCFTVHDKAGLEALPDGTIITDRDDDAYLIDDDGALYDVTLLEDGTLEEFDKEWAKIGTHFNVLHYEPLVVENASILGDFHPAYAEGDTVRIVTDGSESTGPRHYLNIGSRATVKSDPGKGSLLLVGVSDFHQSESCSQYVNRTCVEPVAEEPLAEWERELLGLGEPEPIATPFEVGDTVRITQATTAARFRGLEAEIVSLHQGDAYLLPLSERPDGHGLHKFFWRLDHLELVVEEPDTKEIGAGDIVRVTTGGLEGMVAIVLSDEQVPAGDEYTLGLLVARVSGYDMDDLIFLQPLTDRPDGRGRAVTLGAKSEVEHAA